MSRPGIVVLALAGAALGVVAEQQAYRWTDLRGWLPDVITGWALLGFGLALLAGLGSRAAGSLLVTASFAWFGADFATTGPADVRWTFARAAYFHRGPLLALAFVLPTSRAGSRAATVGVAVAWFTALVWPVWNSPAAALITSSLLVALAIARRSTARGWAERAGATRGLVAVSILVVVIAAGAIRHLAGGGQRYADALALVYAGSVLLAGAALFDGARSAVPGVLAERAVLLERRGSRLRDVLRELLGDPGLEIEFGATGGSRASVQSLTPVSLAGRTLAVVAHAPTTLDDPATRTAVLSAVGLAAERMRLQVELDGQIAAVAESRRRLVAAEEDERRRLAARLDRAVGGALEDVRSLIGRAGAGSDGSGALDRALRQLAEIEPELERLVAGLRVADESELRAALRRLAATVPLDVRLELEPVALGADAASALWFVCSESLANAAKHAAAGSVVVTLSQEGGAARLEVADDGRGGADPAGSGLVGLSDRVAAVGGRLSIVSPAGGGTRVIAEVPQDAG